MAGVVLHQQERLVDAGRDRIQRELLVVLRVVVAAARQAPPRDVRRRRRDLELELRDSETGTGMKLDFDDDARKRYTASFDEYCSGLQTMALRSGGRYAGIATSQSLESVIFGDLIRVRGIA